MARAGPIGVGLLAGLLAVTPAGAQSSLKSRRDILAGNHPIGAIAVDFDGDGFLDLVSVDQFDDALGMVKGFGDGTLRRVSEIAVGSLPTAVAFADADNDGLFDLITANLRSQEITVNLNDGQGGFAPKLSSQILGFTPTGMAVGDWNRDGRLDAALVAASLNTMAVLTGYGNGRFGSPVQYAVGSAPKQVIAADFNRDGNPDLAVVNAMSPNVQIWRGDALGQFALQATLATGLSPQGLAAADLDNDADLDLVVCNYGSDTVGVYLGNGGGGFGAPSLLSPGFGPRAALVTDINKDGKGDLLVTLSKISGVGQAATLLGNGLGGFGTPSLVNTGPVPNMATLGDFNGDDNIDLVTVNLTGNTLSILQNTGGGAFLFGGKIGLANGAFPQGVVAADFNRDGKADVASANQGQNDVSVAYGDGAGGFSPPGSSIRTGTTPSALAADDFNRDGNVDLVTANNGSGTVTLLQNGGTSFNTYSVSTCDDPVSVATGDVSGDLIADIAVACEATNELCTRRATGQSGNGTFGTSVCSPLAGAPADVVLGHFDADAFADPAVSFQVLNTVAVAVSNGQGGISGTPASFPVGLRPTGLARADLDGDGVLDLLVANGDSSSLSVFLRGDPGAPAIVVPTGLSPTALALADFNLDGMIDVAVTNTDDNNVSLLLGDGAGGLTNAGFFGTRDLPVALGAGDFNRDGKPDLAVADSFSDSLTILLNQSLPGDPLQWVSMLGGGRSVFRWGLVPGAAYDVIRGRASLITERADDVDLGPVDCLADDIAVNDTAASPDVANPPENEAFFYLARANQGGEPGDYTVASNGKIGTPSSGGCN